MAPDPTELLAGHLRLAGVRAAPRSEVLAEAPGVAASTGSACHEGGESGSGVLVAVGIEPESALGAVRLSLGRDTSGEQVEQAAAALVQVFGRVSG